MTALIEGRKSKREKLGQRLTSTSAYKNKAECILHIGSHTFCIGFSRIEKCNNISELKDKRQTACDSLTLSEATGNYFLATLYSSIRRHGTNLTRESIGASSMSNQIIRQVQTNSQFNILDEIISRHTRH